MKKLKNRVLLIIALVLCCVKLSAQDKITLNWQVSSDGLQKDLDMTVTTGKTFKVNWGDGKTDNYTDDGQNWMHLQHTYATSGEYTVNITANQNCQFILFRCSGQNATDFNFNNCNALEVVSCVENPLTQLTLKGYAQLRILHCENNLLKNLTIFDCPELTDIYCFNNQLTQLNITSPNLNILNCSNNQLSHINMPYHNLDILACYKNRLSLSELYALHLLVEDNSHKWLGAQNLPPTWVNLNTELFADQSIFNGIYTQYVVEIDDAPAPEDSYTVTDGKLIFHTQGTYTVTMTNDAIVSKEDDIVKVTVVLEVVPLGISENDLAEVKVYPNPTADKLHVTCHSSLVTNIDVFDVYGRKQKAESRRQSHLSLVTCHETVLDMSELPAGVYFVRITTEQGVVMRKVVKR